MLGIRSRGLNRRPSRLPVHIPHVLLILCILCIDVHKMIGTAEHGCRLVTGY